MMIFIMMGVDVTLGKYITDVLVQRALWVNLKRKISE